MTWDATTPPSSGKHSANFPNTSPVVSMNTSTPGLRVTTYPIGSTGSAARYLPPRSSDTERAVELLREAWIAVRDLPSCKARLNALDLIEEAGMWVKDIE